MNLKSIIIGIFCLSALASCKIDKRYKLRPLPPQYAEKKGTGKVVVVLKAIVPEDDTFQLFYATDGTENYSQDTSLFTQVTGKDTPQDIVFQLPDEAAPTAIRLDFGENTRQDNITIENFTVTYYGKSLTISGNDFFQYFRVNECLEKGNKANVVKPKKANDNYDPVVFPEDKFKAALKTILVK